MSLLAPTAWPDAFDLVVQDLVASLDPEHPSFKEQLAAVEADASREEMNRSFRAYIPAAWRHSDPAPFMPNWHVDAVADHLQAVKDGGITRLIINMPTGTAKSRLCCVLFPTWLWGPADRPEERLLALSYGGGNTSPAWRDARTARSLLQSPWYLSNWGNRVRLSDDQNAIPLYSNTRGGYRVSTGIDGAASGQRCDGMILDDVSKLMDRFSPAALQHPVDVFNNELNSRLDQVRNWVVVVMQRLAKGDLVDHLRGKAAEQGWLVLSIPRLYEPKTRCQVFVNGGLFYEDPRTRRDEPLHPQRVSEEASVKFRVTMPWQFAAEEQQEPTPLEGGMVKTAWLRRWHVAGSCGTQGFCPACLPDAWDQQVQSWDCAFKKGSRNSLVTGGAWGRRQARVYLLEQLRGHWGLPETMDALLRLSEKWPAAEKLVEDKANGPAVIQMLGDVVPGLVGQPVEGSKEARMAAVAPFFRAANVYIPEDTARNLDGELWVPEWVAEVTQFPAVTHTDQADQTSQAIWHLLGDFRAHSVSFAALNAGAPSPPFDVSHPDLGRGNGHAERAPARVEGTGFSGGTPPFDIGGISRLFGGR